MKIKRLYINNYKSLVDFELAEPNPFSVFVGPNAAGKSNVFEALEFLSLVNDAGRADELFGGAGFYLNKNELPQVSDAYNKQPLRYNLSLVIETENFKIGTLIKYFKKNGTYLPVTVEVGDQYLKGSIEEQITRQERLWKQYRRLFSRIFVWKKDLVKTPIISRNKLALDAANLEPVLHRILQDESKQEEISDWLQMLIPGLDRVEVAKSDLSGDYFLRIFEKHLDEPIGKNLISDGTYNILALLTAVYQNDEPQFLCIEEPENGLNPYVIRTLVGFFRQMCEEKGHYIWLNTHSATLVRELRNEEIILIDKKEGITRAKQIPADFNRYDLEMDEAWLTNALGGGLPW
jgi:predicted ATPase